MSASLEILPVWKKHPSAVDWLQKLAAIALVHPEQFEKAVIVYQETKASGNTVSRTASRGATINELIGIIEIGKLDLIEDSRK